MSETLASEIAALGTYFAFETSAGPPVSGDLWRPLRDLLDDPDVLARHYRQYQARLESTSGKAVQFRVAASTGHLALVSRLICPAFGAALLGYRLDLTTARWQAVVGGVMPLFLPASAIGGAGEISALLTGPIQTLTELTVGMSVSPKVLWGNVSSAVNGAVMAACDVRPELAAKAMGLGIALGTVPGPDFRRMSCCLIYRIAPPGSGPVCGDCVLNPAPLVTRKSPGFIR